MGWGSNGKDERVWMCITANYLLETIKASMRPVTPTYAIPDLSTTFSLVGKLRVVATLVFEVRPHVCVATGSSTGGLYIDVAGREAEGGGGELVFCEYQACVGERRVRHLLPSLTLLFFFLFSFSLLPSSSLPHSFSLLSTFSPPFRCINDTDAIQTTIAVISSAQADLIAVSPCCSSTNP